MSAAEVSIRMSRLERPASIGPAERLFEEVIEIVNKIEHPSLKIIERGKACAFEKSSGEDGEPNLDLIEPRAVSWGIDETNSVRRVLQKLAARSLRLKDPDLAFDAECFFDATAFSH